MSRQSWSLEEDEAINKLVTQHGIEDWTKIAIKLRDHLGMQKRTGKQCRERWYNHLSPAVSKKPWTQQQQELLFTCHKNIGNRWKDISKLFVGRTDNDIKNHFYSTLRRSLRRLNKIVGEKNSTTQMREIKPSVLSTIMSYIYDQEQHSQLELLESLKDLPLLIFEFATFKPIKVNIKTANIELIKEKTFEIFSLVSRFNEQYEKNKAFRRNLKTERIRKKSSYQESVECNEFQLKIQENSSYVNVQESHAEEEEKQHKEGVVTIKIEEQSVFFQKQADYKLTNNTQMTLQQQTEGFVQEEEALPISIFQFTNSPKQSMKYPSHRAFSLESDELNDLHFQLPQEPSHLNIEEQEYIRFNNEMESQKDRYHHVELIDQVIETHFAS